MPNERPQIVLRRERTAQTFALGALLLMGGIAIAGPSGFLAWSENLRMLDQRHAEIAQREQSLAALKNRVSRLDPAHADPDLVGELLRERQNVARPDELIYIYR